MYNVHLLSLPPDLKYFNDMVLKDTKGQEEHTQLGSQQFSENFENLWHKINPAKSSSYKSFSSAFKGRI